MGAPHASLSQNGCRTRNKGKSVSQPTPMQGLVSPWRQLSTVIQPSKVSVVQKLQPFFLSIPARSIRIYWVSQWWDLPGSLHPIFRPLQSIHIFRRILHQSALHHSNNIPEHTGSRGNTDTEGGGKYIPWKSWVLYLDRFMKTYAPKQRYNNKRADAIILDLLTHGYGTWASHLFGANGNASASSTVVVFEIKTV